MESGSTRREKAQARREERLHRTMQQKIDPRWTRRSGRRFLVWAGAACLGLLWAASVVCWFLAPSDTAMWTTFALAIVASLAGCVVFGQLFLVTRGMTRLPEHLLDERQVNERLRAHAQAHRATLTLLLLVAILVPSLVTGDEAVTAIPGAAVAVFFMALLATVAALPLMLAAWRMPDPLPDDED